MQENPPINLFELICQFYKMSKSKINAQKSGLLRLPKSKSKINAQKSGLLGLSILAQTPNTKFRNPRKL